MLQKLREEIQTELARIEESKTAQFAVLGEDLSTSKDTGEWKAAFAEDLSQIRERRDMLKEKGRTVESWKKAEDRGNTIRTEIQELEAAYTSARGELEMHFEDIGAAAYDLYQQTPTAFDETADLLNDMQELESGIREKELELRRLQTETKPSSFFAKTLNKGRGMVIRGSLKTREFQRGKRLKQVGEHICESLDLPDLPEGSSLAKQLAPLTGATTSLRDVCRELAAKKAEAEAIDNERIAIEREERMRNPVKNLEHDMRRIGSELAEIYVSLGRKFYESDARSERVTERISRTVSAIGRLDDEKERHEKLLFRVDAGLVVTELEKKKEKLDAEQQSLKERIDTLSAAQADMQALIDAKAKERGSVATLKLPQSKKTPKKNSADSATDEPAAT